eukprot:TRINITY_DN11624_c0_g1_i1.p1 TRINITY_DN11624_c0_g1~~TRINITY_DN11624_c0_g1_i1.p1  ORF type:complete len:393 (-),score=82.52 TRINITY_DN11624_c0_g1_i1:161-1339(-)
MFKRMPYIRSLNLVHSVWLLWIFLLQSNGQNDWVIHDPGGNQMKQVIACSPNPMNISCPFDHNIEIINGNYGRFTITLCNNQGAQNLSVNCYLDEAMGYMRDRCNGKRSCHIRADTFQIKQDPCPGTERYLEAHYRCVPNQDLSAGMPPWMISADSQKNKKKPGRVPITAPPTTTTTTTTTTSTPGFIFIPFVPHMEDSGIETPAPPPGLLDNIDTVNLASEVVAPLNQSVVELAIAVTLTGTIGLPTVPMEEISTTTSQPQPVTQLGQISEELPTTTEPIEVTVTAATTSTTTTIITTLATSSTTPATTRVKTSTTTVPTTTTETTTLAIFFPGFFGGIRTGSSEEEREESQEEVNDKKGFIDEIRTLLFSNFVEEGGKVMKGVWNSFLGR